MSKLVLIDGHSILNRAFYGVPDLTNAAGLHTNAIYGFLNILFKILDEESPDYLTVAFDVKAPTFRHEMFKEYKGTRKPMPEELREQVPVMKEVLQAMGIRIIEQAGYEADDLLGTIAKRAEAEGIDVSLVSGDRDLLQIATDRIRIRIPKTKGGRTEIENYYAADVEAKYQVNPVQTEKLYNKALEYADLSGNEIVWDLYCGIGSISLFLAKKAKKVLGVEIVPEAIEDARLNAKINKIDNSEFFVGAAEDVVTEYFSKHENEAECKPDVIVVDPPRKGCDEKLLSTIVKMNPKRVVYVSCDSATLARDVKWLSENGYKLKEATPCDMFGQTIHVETVCLLSRKEPN